MALENQINLYSVDTGNFYTRKERNLHNKNAKIRSERKKIVEKIKSINDLLVKSGYSSEEIGLIYKHEINKDKIINGTNGFITDLYALTELRKMKTHTANVIKNKLVKLLENKTEAKGKIKPEKFKDNIHLRNLDGDTITDKNVISLFESSLTRTIGVKKDELTDDIMVVQVYYFDIFKDISFYGFLYKGEKYKYFTSSAGQIRKKKAVFIKESVWNEYEKTIMCGLTIDKINSKGGNNVNKHLAYMALTNSATDEWTNLDIDKTIVVEDFETNVFGEYDFIDDSDYSITRMQGEVPITHTDGAGMVLYGKNRMLRIPWGKGLLGVFDFRKLILEWRVKYNNNSIGIITDIYEKQHDVIEEEIEIILTKSQFKMYKYYDSWDQYKEYFKKYNCKAGVCNVEEDRIKNSRINYQEIQTLTEMAEEDLLKISNKSVEKLKKLCSSIKDLQSAFGVSVYNTSPTPLQEAIEIYPNIMNDTYFKDIIKQIKDSLIKKYKSAKLEIDGKYTFLLPDFYAACEFWFLGDKNPNGLLGDKEVWCNLYKNKKELDCLRSPHLYKEHAIRNNVACTGNEERKLLISKWFTTNAIYTSCDDLISKILMFDVDGDRSLVIADEKYIEVAKASMKDIVPLYYNMKKAEPKELNAKNIYEGLNAAFTGGNIGIYSNNISKIWNSNVFVNGTDEQKLHATNIVKILCMENNYVIDYAKTLYKPTRPNKINKEILKFTNKKVPYFFIYAKDKETSQVETKNNSIVNKLDDIIPNIRINTRKIGLGKIDYKLLMNDVNIEIDEKLIGKYEELSETYHFKISMKDEYQSNLHYLACEMRKELSSFGYDESQITDMLVKYLYGLKKSRYKEVFWFCYGKQIVTNLKKNVPVKKTKLIQCIDCGEWLEIPIESKSERCDKCQHEYRKEWNRQRMREKRNK